MMSFQVLSEVVKGAAHRAAPFLVLPCLFLTGCSPDALFLSEQSGISDETWSQVQTYQSQVQNDPEVTEPMYSLATAYLQALRETSDVSLYEKVELLMKRADELEPDNLTTVFFRAQVDLGRHHFEEARKKGERLVQTSPEVARYHGVLADAQIELGEYEEALNSLQTMIDLRPDFSSYTRIAYAREIFGDLEGAIEMMELSVESGTAVKENVAWSFAELGRLWMGVNVEFSRAAYQRALDILPDFPAALEGLGRLEAFEGNLERGLELVQKAFDQMPLPQYAATLGDLFVLQGNDQRAEVYYKLVEIGYDRIASSGTDVVLERAQFLVTRKRQLEKALELAKEVYEARPTIFAADTYAWALFLNDQQDEARQVIQQALRTESRDARILYHAGVILSQKRFLDQALQMNPRFSLLEVRELEELRKQE